ncbi:MAG: dockerin, partial [Clostridiaceae bacterium]|nr:dockerin [Clostridiaceae bacterium]
MKRIFSICIISAMFMSVTMQISAINVSALEQNLSINEVMAANTSTIRDGDSKNGSDSGDFSDWIELYNPNEKPLDIKGYTLSDSGATWTFPEGVVPSKGYLLVWCSDKNKVTEDGQLHTNFKISASGETITLKKPDGSVEDKLTIPALRDDQSYGCKTDGAAEFVIFSKSTPLASNVYTPEATAVKMPVFSHKGGFYNEKFDLKITTDEADVKIYYTKDGTDPEPGNESTIEFEGNIEINGRTGDPNVYSLYRNPMPDYYPSWQDPNGEIFKCTVLKAVAIREDGVKSKIVTHSYFVEPNMKTRYSIPVVSLVTDPANLFDSEKGIYSYNYLNKGSEWERPMHMEFFEPDGTLGFSQYVGARISGGETRYLPQKSFRIYFDKGYDDKNKVKYDIFPGLTKRGDGKKLDTFERLILRNGGNDNQSLLFRDSLLQGLVSHLKIDIQASRPSVVFLDGEYWGIYNFRERYDSEYIKYHYNADKEKVAMLDVWEYPEVLEGENSDAGAYMSDLIYYLKENSISQPGTYEYIKTKMDLENYIDYNIAQIMVGNNDWPGNNTTVWKYKTEDEKYNPEAPYGLDGRWRWMLRDTDFGYGIWGKSPAHNTLCFALGDFIEPGMEYANSPGIVFLLNTLLENEDFRNEFINHFADQMNTSFRPERVHEEIDKAKKAIELEMPEHLERYTSWGLSMNSWYRDIDYIKYYATERPYYVRRHITDKFESAGVTGTGTIKLNTDSSKGYIRINSIDIK